MPEPLSENNSKSIECFGLASIIPTAVTPLFIDSSPILILGIIPPVIVSFLTISKISEEDIYYDQENKVWLWEVDGHLFSNEEFHMNQGGNIEDFENWIRDKEPVDSIEDVTSYKVH